MKKIVSLVLALLLALGLTACGEPKEPVIEKLDVTANVFAIKGPTGIGMAPLMDKAEKNEGLLNYKFNLVGSNEEIVAKIGNKESDIAAVATNLASTLYNKTNGGVSVIAINTLGVLNVVAKGEEIQSIKDLKGKTILSTGQGANPEYIINYVLEKNGLKVGEDVTVKFVTQPTELIAHVNLSDKAIVVAPQPVATNITLKNKDAKIVLDISKEWDKISDTKLVMGCVIARNEFIKQNPEAVKAFLKDYKDSITAVNSDIETAAALCEKYEIVTPAAAAKAAIPYCNIAFQEGKELKTNLSAYLNFLNESNPQSIGGALPKDDFYYEAK